jgi:non-specific serine/threonine protein kinase/serine/threonine-protein kinase
MVAPANPPVCYPVAAASGLTVTVAFESRSSAPELRDFVSDTDAADAATPSEVEALLSAGASAPRGSAQVESAAIGTGQKLDEHTLSAGQIIAKRYRLVRELGEGGMGRVWLGEQLTPVRRAVAVKFIKAGMYDDALVQRFASERHWLAIMDHPAIAKVFDAGMTALGQPYFIMEYVPGLSITAHCDQHRIGIRGCLELLIQACNGVQHAHQKAVIHSDLKPANILVVEVEGKAAPIIIDFGLARVASPECRELQPDQSTHFFGTPGYISPEQVAPGIPEIDARTDVYSLGVILYVLLTGLQPFESAREPRLPFEELQRRLREDDPLKPSAKLLGEPAQAIECAAARGLEPKALMRELRADLDWIACKALARDRNLRYATPAEFAADLGRYLNHEPVLARSASAMYKARKLIKRIWRAR